jgi:DNA-binding response OmpR family regulator
MASKKLKVLVIDDHKTVADTLTMVLNMNGFDAFVAYSGERGLDLARHAPFDHLVTDVMMEPMDGIQTAIAIKSICPDCTVLLISGNEQTANRLANAVRNGHDFEILAKPFHPTVLLERLRGGATGTLPAKEH